MLCNERSIYCTQIPNIVTYSVTYKDLGLILPLFFFHEMVFNNPTRVCDLHVMLRQAKHTRKILYRKLALSKVASIFKETLKKKLDYNEFVILFNHFSVLLELSKQSFSNYWFSLINIFGIFKQKKNIFFCKPIRVERG